MSSKPSAVALVIGILATSMLVASAEAAQTGPIRIEHLQTSGGFYQDAIHDMNVLPASLEITFENQSNVDATAVVFSVESNGFIDQFSDVGKFAKGVPIRHSFSINPFGVSGNPDVQVVRVSFADGSVWEGPSAP